MTRTLENPVTSHRSHAPPTFGLACGFGAYLWWGFVPIYFRAVRHVEPIQVLAHRVIWSVLFLLVLTGVTRGFDELRSAWRDRRTLLMLAASTLVLSINWFVFILAVGRGMVMQASLGYFINPLVSVMLGMIFLHERMRRLQWVGLVLATVGVVYLTWSRGQLPWVALILACSFGLYGLLRKLAPVGAMPGLTIETAILLVPCLLLVGWDARRPGDYDLPTMILLGAAGIITAVPLLMFAAATRRLRLSTMGFLQYVGPTCQFLLAVFAFGEPFRSADLVSFALIWSALILYSTDSYLAYRAGQAAIPSTPPEP